MTSENRGGPRPGTGRPIGTTKAEKRVTLATRVDPITRQKIEAEAEARGLSTGKLLDEIFRRRKPPAKGPQSSPLEPRSGGPEAGV